MKARREDDALARGEATLVASWTAYATGAADATVRHHSGVDVAVFPAGAERVVYNNALLAPGLTTSERSTAIDAMEATYQGAGIDRFAAWVHDSDVHMRADLERRRYTVETTTLAMSVNLERICDALPALTLGSLPWVDYLSAFDLPAGLLEPLDHDAFHLLVAFDNREPITTAMSYDHDGDCGIYNVGTVEHARRRGFGRAITALQLQEAVRRGCITASLQSTGMAERVYAAAGFRSLGRYLEFVPPTGDRVPSASAARA